MLVELGPYLGRQLLEQLDKLLGATLPRIMVARFLVTLQPRLLLRVAPLARLLRWCTGQLLERWPHRLLLPFVYPVLAQLLEPLPT